jgi:hypothetical protein
MVTPDALWEAVSSSVNATASASQPTVGIIRLHTKLKDGVLLLPPVSEVFDAVTMLLTVVCQS